MKKCPLRPSTQWVCVSVSSPGPRCFVLQGNPARSAGVTVRNASAEQGPLRTREKTTMDGLSDNPSDPPKNVSERWDGQTQNGSKIACSRIAIRTEKNVM